MKIADVRWRLGLIASLIFLAGCDNPAKMEMARRTQCAANLNLLAKSIEGFRKTNDRWPTALGELPIQGELYRCPSAERGEGGSAGFYVWDATALILTESISNHDPARFCIRELSSVTFAVVFDPDGGWEVRKDGRLKQGQSADRETAMAIARREMEAMGWKEFTVDDVQFEANRWSVRLTRVPVVFGGHAVVKVSTNGTILEVIHGR